MRALVDLVVDITECPALLPERHRVLWRALTDELEIPQRWYEAIVFMLSHRMSLELPNVDVARIQYLEGQAEKYWLMAEQEERDKSPIYFAPNISVYTR